MRQIVAVITVDSPHENDPEALAQEIAENLLLPYTNIGTSIDWVEVLAVQNMEGEIVWDEFKREESH